MKSLAQGVVCFVGLLIVWPGAAVADDASTGSRFTADESKIWVRLHNEARREVGTPPLAWSTELAEYAQAWADELARTGRFEHRPADGPWALEYGESLAIGFGDAAAVETAFRLFLREKEQYEPGTAIDETNLASVGHYTAVVWRTTTHVGAGRAVITTGDMAGATIFVSNYDPPGNSRGKTPY
jgi:pathogenesis-related protein 1